MPLRDEYRLPPAGEALENGKMTLKMRFREYSDATRGLMRRCLEWDPEERCSARGALQHAYFKEEPRGYSTTVYDAHCSSRSCFVTYFPGGAEHGRQSVTHIGMRRSNGRSTQKRGFVFDAEELAAAHGGLVKKYKKG